MSASIKVVEPGLHTTVQDLGRFGYQAMGVPVAGALDPVSLRLANALVGNPQHTGGLEYLYRGPVLEVGAESVRVTAAGAEMEVLGERRRVVSAWRSTWLQRGETFRLNTPGGASCGYLAVAGGFALAPELGSLSTYTRSRIGGLQGCALGPGDLLPLARDSAIEGEELSLGDPPDLTPPTQVRVVLGPQQDFFTASTLHAFVSSTFAVSKHADRMGLRLDGPKLDHKSGYNIVSDGIVTGAIQVPGSGQPIVLLADHQTTGGYPKIATIISTDLPAVGRLRPGDPVRFVEVSVAQAEAAARDLENDIAHRVAALVPCFEDARLDESALTRSNLISGVVNAMD